MCTARNYVNKSRAALVQSTTGTTLTLQIRMLTKGLEMYSVKQQRMNIHDTLLKV